MESPINKNANLAIVSPSQNGYSETFIHAHLTYLPFNKFYYFGGDLPVFSEKDGNLLRSGILNRSVHFIGNKFLSWENWHEWQLLKNFKKTGINVVLAEYGPTGAKILPVCQKLNIPLLVHFHGYDASVQEVVKEYEDIYKAMFSYASYIIVVSKSMYEGLQHLGCPKEKLVLNTYGPHDEFFELTPDFKLPKFVSIGRFVDKKAPYYLILAFKRVVSEFPEAKLVIGGDGYLMNSCNNLVKYFDLNDNITLPGILSRQEFMQHLKSSLAYLQHSVTAENGDMEGTPVSILEAQAAGIPVIATRHAGIVDVVMEDKTGLLVNEHDVDEFANCIITLLKNREKAKQLGEMARSRIKSNFNLKQHIGNITSLVNASIKL